MKGNPDNDRDGVFRGIRDAKAQEMVLVDFKPMKESKIGELAANFDIVMGVTPEDPPKEDDAPSKAASANRKCAADAVSADRRRADQASCTDQDPMDPRQTSTPRQDRTADQAEFFFSSTTGITRSRPFTAFSVIT